MASGTQTFVLVGDFKDNITPKLKKLSKTFAALERSVNRGFTRGFKDLNKEFRDFSKDVGRMGKVFEAKNRRGVDRFRSQLKAAREDAIAIGDAMRASAKAGDDAGSNFRKGLRAAQEEAKVLGDILKANALIKVGEGFSNAINAGAQGTVNTLKKGAAFVKNQFDEAVQDQLQDIQARGSLFGSLNKQKLFGEGPGAAASAEERAKFINDNYKQTKNINRSMEKAIGDVVRTSTVSTSTITTLSRQLSDNLLPTMLKAKGVTDISGMSREELDKVMGGEKGVGKELATLYEQIGSVVPNASYAPQAARAVSEFLGKGKVNRQLAIFEQNPVLVEALEENVKKYGNTMEGKIRALKEAFEVAMPKAALDEARNTIAGGLQSIGDSLTNASVGIASMGADIANQGEETAKLMKESGIYDIQLKSFIRRQEEFVENMRKNKKPQEDINKVLVQQKKNLAEYKEKLEDIYTSADSPIEMLSVVLAPAMQKFADLISEFGNIFLGPVEAIIKAIGPTLAQLADNFESLASDVRSKDRSPAEALGRALGEITKAIATLFDPDGVLEDGQTAIGKIFTDFMKGFQEIDGEKYLKQIMDGIMDLIMKALFNDGNILKGPTNFGKLLGGIFMVFAAPAFISSLIAGLVPIAVMALGGMLKSVFFKMGPKAMSRMGPGGFGAALLGRQANAAAKVGGQLPGVAKAAKAAKLAKMKGIGAIAAGMVTLATKAPKLAKAGKAVLGLTKRIPVLSVALAGLDYASKRAEGKSQAQAIGGAGGSLVGGMAGAAIGSAILPGAGTVAGGVIGSFIGDYLGEQIVTGLNKLKGFVADPLGSIKSAIDSAKAGLATSETNIKNWFLALPGKFGKWSVDFEVGTQDSWARMSDALGKWKDNMVAGVSKWASETNAVWSDRLSWWSTAAKNAITGKIDWGGMADSLANGVIGWLKEAKGKIDAFLNGGKWMIDQFNASRAAALAEVEKKKKEKGESNAYGHSGVTSLGNAINTEIRNKPAGSHLVIANSSETVIPAAGGYGDGVKGLIDAVWRSANEVASTAAKGFDVMVKTTADGDKAIAAVTVQTGAQTKAAIDRSISVQMAESSKLMSAIKAASAFGGFGGGGMALGSGYGGKGVAIAGALGNFIKQTGGAPGSIHEHPAHGGVRGRHAPGSYHYSGRAIDIGAYANEQAGVIARIKQFNAQNGVKPVEFLHAGNDPNHQDHVHVAYAGGLKNPYLFTTAQAAQAFESMYAPANARVASITANSSEFGFGQGITLNVTNNINGAGDPQAVAEAVWDYTAKKVQQLQTNSFA